MHRGALLEPLVLDRWGEVIGGPEKRVRIERSRDGRGNATGFLLLTEEAAGTFDCWLESEADVRAFLQTRTVRWMPETDR